MCVPLPAGRCGKRPCSAACRHHRSAAAAARPRNAQHIDVAVGHLVGGEDVVIRNDDELIAIPDLGILTEVLLEDADGARPADIVRHENVHVDPDVVAGHNPIAAGVAGEDLFGQRHRTHGESAPRVIEQGQVCYYTSCRRGRLCTKPHEPEAPARNPHQPEAPARNDDPPSLALRVGVPAVTQRTDHAITAPSSPCRLFHPGSAIQRRRQRLQHPLQRLADCPSLPDAAPGRCLLANGLDLQSSCLPHRFGDPGEAAATGGPLPAQSIGFRRHGAGAAGAVNAVWSICRPSRSS